MPYVCWHEADAWSSNTDSQCIIRRQNQKCHSTLPHSPGNGHIFLQKRKKKILELQCSETSFSVEKGQQGRKQTHSWHSPEHSVPQTQSQAIAKPHIIETQLTLYVCILFNKLFLKKKQRGTQNGIFIQKKISCAPSCLWGFNTYTQSIVIVFTPLPSGIPTPSLWHHSSFLNPHWLDQNRKWHLFSLCFF